MIFFALLVTILCTLLPIVYSKVLNDNCTGAIIIPSDVSALPYTSTIPNFENATLFDPSDPNIYDSNTRCPIFTNHPQSVWYYWEPSSTTLVDFSAYRTGPYNTYHPNMIIFEGENCKKLKELTCRGSYLPAFEATEGKKYYIFIVARALYYTKNTVTFGVSKTPLVPPNDECVDALVIPSTILFPFSTPPTQLTSATENLNDPVTSCSMTPPFLNTTTIETVWYTWIPEVSGLYDISSEKSISVAFGISEIDTVIEIYTGKSCASVKEVTCKSVKERLRGVKVDAGIKYFIKVMTEYGDYGTSLILTVNPTPTAPLKNDDCINAVVVDPLKGEIISGDTFYAISENITSTASCTVYDTPGLWYKFSVPKAMRIDVSTCNAGTIYDTSILIFSGDQCGELNCLDFTRYNGVTGCPTHGSKKSFIASEGTTYYILVSGEDVSVRSGNFIMTVVGTENYFALIDSNKDKILQPMDNDVTLYYWILPSASLNIQASFNDSIKSAMITFDNPRRSVCEKNAPFAIFGNNRSDYFGVPIPDGPHTVTATPYNQANCNGPAGTNISKSFEMEECYYNYFYYDFASNSTDRMYLRPDRRILSCKINIEVAVECGFDIGFVKFTIRERKTNQIVQRKKEREAPYFAFGNRGKIINNSTLKPGRYTIDINIDGIQHTSTRFSVIDEGQESCK